MCLELFLLICSDFILLLRATDAAGTSLDRACSMSGLIVITAFRVDKLFFIMFVFRPLHWGCLGFLDCLLSPRLSYYIGAKIRFFDRCLHESFSNF